MGHLSFMEWKKSIELSEDTKLNVLLLAFLLLLQVVLSTRANFCLVGYFMKRFKALYAVPGTTPAIGWYTTRPSTSQSTGRPIRHSLTTPKGGQWRANFYHVRLASKAMPI